MATQKQRHAAKRNVKKAQAGAKSKQTLKKMPSSTKTALGKEANKVRKGDAKTRAQLNEEAARLEIRGRSKMGKDELRRAVARAR
ncbi:MAG: hypothetical protein GEU88_10485 [Solirubrobacterales bacterium]|nr:hypothetical protein [Solirubrobacterales bacterium]